FNPIAAEPERSSDPVLPVPYRPLNAVARRLVAGLGLRTADPHWEDLPGLLRSSAAAIAADEAAADRALACGARALLLGRPGDGERGPAVPTDASALRSDAAAEALARLRAAGPLAPDEVRAALRSVFLTDATPVRLAEVLGRLDLAPGSGGAGQPPAARAAVPGRAGWAPGPGGAGQPLAGRRTAVLAAPLDATESLALADDLLKQAHPAAQVVVPEAAARFTGVERLRSFGLPVRAVPVPDGGGAARWAALAREADAPWSALWHGPRGEARLADLVCAAECSGGDAVGEAAVPGGDAVRAVGADQDYVFVGAVRPDLVRTALAARGIDPGLWN